MPESVSACPSLARSNKRLGATVEIDGDRPVAGKIGFAAARRRGRNSAPRSGSDRSRSKSRLLVPSVFPQGQKGAPRSARRVRRAPKSLKRDRSHKVRRPPRLRRRPRVRIFQQSSREKTWTPRATPEIATAPPHRQSPRFRGRARVGPHRRGRGDERLDARRNSLCADRGPRDDRRRRHRRRRALDRHGRLRAHRRARSSRPARRRRPRRDDPALSRQGPVFAARPANGGPIGEPAGLSQRVRAREGPRRAHAHKGLCGRRREAAHGLGQFLPLRPRSRRTTISSSSTTPQRWREFERNFDAIWARATNVEIECPREREEGGRRGPPTLCPGQAAPPADFGANSAGRAEILAR